MSHKYKYKYNKYKARYQHLIGGVNDNPEILVGLSNKERAYLLDKLQNKRTLKFNTMDGNINIEIEKKDTTNDIKNKIKRWYLEQGERISIESIVIYINGIEEAIDGDILSRCGNNTCFILLRQEPEINDPQMEKMKQFEAERQIDERNRVREERDEIRERAKRDREIEKQIELTIKYGVTPSVLFGEPLSHLNGCDLLYYYPDIYGRKVLLLGETHHINGCEKCNISEGCMDIDTYVNSLVEKQSGCIDFYIEDKYPNIMSGGAKRNIDTTRDYWNEKLNGVPNIPYLRLHRWDLRQDSDSKIMTPWIHAFDKNQIRWERIKEMEAWVELKGISIEYLVDNIARYTIYGESRGVNMDIIYQFLYYICGYRINRWDDQYRKNREKIKKAVSKLSRTVHLTSDIIIDKFINCWKKTIIHNIQHNNLAEIIHDFGLLTSDLYLLSRMFTTFDYDTETKRERSPSGCGLDYKIPKNIICFAGQAHIEFIHKMIHILYPEISKPDPIRGDNKCVHFNDPIRFF